MLVQWVSTAANFLGLNLHSSTSLQMTWQDGLELWKLCAFFSSNDMCGYQASCNACRTIQAVHV